jgi:hypothetical protein
MPQYYVVIAINLKIEVDCYIEAADENEARLGIQTLIDNGVYTTDVEVYAAGAPANSYSVKSSEITIQSVEEI